VRLPTLDILTVAALASLVACDKGPAKAQLETDVRRLQEESRQLQEKAASYQKTLQEAAALAKEVRRLEEENRQLKGQLAAYQAASQVASEQASSEQASSQGSKDSKARETIDPEQYRAQLNAMIGWTKQQVAARLGNPHKTDQGGQDWYYRFTAQDKFGVVYRHIQINFNDSGRVSLTAIGQSDYAGSP